MADQRLSEETQKNLLSDFEKVEAERIGGGAHEKFHELLQNFKKEYLS